MTPEERYERIDQRLDAIAVNLELTSRVAHENEIRLGQLDARLDKMAAHQEEQYAAFNDEHKKLLTSQVLLTGTMQELAEAQKATDGRMTILIGMMDTFMRERGVK